MIALEVQELTKRFPSMARPALDKVGFQVEQGKCLGIVGGSGCGKSTLARIVMMLEQPDNGRVLLFGDEIGGKDLKSARDVYRTMQMIFQNPIDSFDPRRTLGFSLMEPGRSFGLSRAEAERKARALLVSVGLDESFFERYPSQVSGGQCQRAAIARALMTDPSVLICDEITSALDVTTQARIVELISQLKKRVTIVFITHDLALASNICDNLVVMEKGRVVECGPACDVLEHPQSDYTKFLLSSAHALNGERACWQITPPFVNNMESVFRLMRKAANVLLSVVLVLGLVPASAFAGEGCAPSADPDAAAIDAILPACEDTTLNSTGGNVDQAESENGVTPGWTECGTCEWMIDDTGLLTVRPLLGLTCGELASWGVWTDVPWYSQRKSITAVRIEPGVSVKTCRYLFYGCSSLASVDLSNLDTSKATSLSSMFTDCSSLASLDLSSLDTSKVASLSFMLEGCASLTSLDLTSLDTSSVTSLSYMFSGCSSLETLDLSALDTSNVTDMRFLFSGCSSLSTVYVSGLFTIDEARSSDFMFAGCTSLVGGAGTTYSAAHTDAAYAHIDAGTNDPGYFTGRRPKGEGDVNGNGVLNVVDAQAAYEIASTDHYENRSDYADMCHRADVTRNGSVDAADAFAIQRAALRGWDTF